MQTNNWHRPAIYGYILYIQFPLYKVPTCLDDSTGLQWHRHADLWGTTGVVPANVRYNLLAMASNLKPMASNLLAMASNLVTTASNLLAMASNLKPMASNLLAMASNLLAMASNPIAMASNLMQCSNNVYCECG